MCKTDRKGKEIFLLWRRSNTGTDYWKRWWSLPPPRDLPGTDCPGWSCPGQAGVPCSLSAPLWPFCPPPLPSVWNNYSTSPNLSVEVCKISLLIEKRVFQSYQSLLNQNLPESVCQHCVLSSFLQRPQWLSVEVHRHVSEVVLWMLVTIRCGLAGEKPEELHWGGMVSDTAESTWGFREITQLYIGFLFIYHNQFHTFPTGFECSQNQKVNLDFIVQAGIYAVGLFIAKWMVFAAL